MTVAENMSVGLRIAGEPRTSLPPKSGKRRASCSSKSLLARLPKQLSGGSVNASPLAAPSCANRKSSSSDEPLSNLDAALRLQMRLELARLRRQLDATMIYVTHDQVEAMTLADKIIVMNAGQIEQAGSPLELYNRPRNLFVAGFLAARR